MTDHVWIECFVEESWIMADSCEGIIDKAAMYEDGWGKELSYQIGVTIDSVMDVSPKYTRQWNNAEYQARRRQICSSEATGDSIIAQRRKILQQGIPNIRLDDLDRKILLEQAHLEKLKTLCAWTDEEKHGRGRISGSLQWKISRQEAGTRKSNDEEKESSTTCALYVEQFYPTGSTVTISVTPNGINVSGAACDVGKSSGISVVVVDENYMGCILQSRGFDSWESFSNFVAILPSNRIIAAKGVVDKGKELSKVTKEKLRRLGSFHAPESNDDGILFIGKIEATPEWAISTTYRKASAIQVSIPKTAEAKPTKLRTQQRVVPRKVAGRLDEITMPFQTQLLASESQKRMAFLAFKENNPEHPCIGYTSKKGSPVYLLDESSFPFTPSNDLVDDVWNTFHFLPQPLVPDDDIGVSEELSKNRKALIDIPVDTTFFIQLFGPSLLVKFNSVPTFLDTANALSLCNSRLVAMYFSAHWCGPCRSFTPMLAEVYSQLKEKFPSQGLEIIFVSSDRDVSSFNNYFASMPWIAVPFEAGAIVQQQIKMKYGIKGIPSLVVLDAMSGQVVVNMADARGEVINACRSGDHKIDEMLQSWLSRIPTESKEMMQLLELSVKSDNKGDDHLVAGRREHPYCVKSNSSVISEEKEVDVCEQIKKLFTKFFAEGMPPNAAAAKALLVVSEARKKVNYLSEAIPWNHVKWKRTICAASGNPEEVMFQTKSTMGEMTFAMEQRDMTVKECVARIDQSYPDGSVVVKNISQILSKYLSNAIRDPSNPKFRSMKLSNKSVDRIVRVDGGLDLMRALGFHIFPTSQDFMACIPLYADLERLKTEVENL